MNRYQRNQYANLQIKQVKKSCPFCTNRHMKIDYQDGDMLNRFISGQAKIKKTKRTGVCTKHQRRLAKAIKRARNLAILPAASVHNFFNVDEKRVIKQKKAEEREKEKIEAEEKTE